TKTGAGRLVLSTANSYLGATSIQEGTLVIGNANAISSSSVGIVLGSATMPAVLDLNGLNATVSSVSTAASNTSSIVGNSSTTTPATLSLSGFTSVNNSIVTNSAGTFAGTIQDSIGGGTQTLAVKITGGRLIVSGNNTYTGGTTIGAS